MIEHFAELGYIEGEGFPGRRVQFREAKSRDLPPIWRHVPMSDRIVEYRPPELCIHYLHNLYDAACVSGAPLVYDVDNGASLGSQMHPQFGWPAWL